MLVPNWKGFSQRRESHEMRECRIFVVHVTLIPSPGDHSPPITRTWRSTEKSFITVQHAGSSKKFDTFKLPFWGWHKKLHPSPTLGWSGIMCVGHSWGRGPGWPHMAWEEQQVLEQEIKAMVSFSASNGERAHTWILNSQGFLESALQSIREPHRVFTHSFLEGKHFW